MDLKVFMEDLESQLLVSSYTEHYTSDLMMQERNCSLEMMTLRLLSGKDMPLLKLSLQVQNLFHTQLIL